MLGLSGLSNSTYRKVTFTLLKMADNKFPLKITLEDRSGEVFGQGSIDEAKDTCTFKDIPKGIYRAKGQFTDGTQAQSNEVNLDPSTSVTFYLKDFLPPQPPLPPPPNKTPWKAIIPSAIGISLLSNFGGAEPIIQEISRQLLNPQTTRPPTQTRNPQPRQARPNRISNRLLSPEVEARLRACIQSNFIRLAEIPTLSSLLESASWEREPTGEFERQIIFLYTRVQQLQAIIEECDPTLIQEILAAQQQANDSAPTTQENVIVIGELVNIRAGPSTDNAILAQMRYGTVLVIDQKTLASLSPSERFATEQGTGWLPVFLPDNRWGYIYSLYVAAQA